MRDASAGTSFLQSLAEIDHRDRHHHHIPNHKHLHQRQVDATVTAVTSTVSVIQNIIIDSNGSTVQIQTWLATPTNAGPAPDTTVPTPVVVNAIPSTTAVAAIPSSSSDGGLTMSQFTLAAASSQASPLTSPPFLSTNSSSE
jgi:hypothetical protein